MHSRVLFSPLLALHHAPIARPLLPPRGASRGRRSPGGSRVASVSHKEVVRSGVHCRSRCMFPNTPKEWPSPGRDVDDDPEYITPWEVPQPSPIPPSRRTEYPEFTPPLDPDYDPSTERPSEVPPVGSAGRGESLSVYVRMLHSLFFLDFFRFRSRIIHHSSDRLHSRHEKITQFFSYINISSSASI